MKKLILALLSGLSVFLMSGCAHAKLGYYRFSQEVTVASTKEALKAIHRAEYDHVGTLIIDLDTPGGSVDAGFEIAKAIEQSTVHIVCVADGEAASMGFYILQSCPVRYMTKRTLLMAHNPSFSLDNEHVTPQILQELLSTLDALANAMAEHCAARLKITVDEYKAKIDGRDWDMNWQEALDVGAVDHVVKSVQEVALLYQ